MVVKIVHDELVALLGEKEATLNFKESCMTVVMIVGLQGTGKTTSVGKITSLLKRKYNKHPMLIAADVIRPAAIEQLQTLGKEVGAEVFSLGTETDAVETVRQGLAHAKEIGADICVLDMELLDTRREKNLLGTFIADLVLQILSFVAESERNSIRKRQAEGIVAAKERGVRFGRPLLLLPENFENAAEAWNEKQISLQQAAKLCRMSVSTFYRKAKAVRKCNETVS